MQLRDASLPLLLTLSSLSGAACTAPPSPQDGAVEDAASSADRPSIDVINDGATDATASQDAAAPEDATVPEDAEVELECRPNEVGCDGLCVDVLHDPLNCGSCGIVCPIPAGGRAVCDFGRCEAACSASQRMCGSGESASCADVASDRENCGACGNVCPGTQVCVAGTCTSSCAAPRTVCGTDGVLRCVDLTSDPRNCGACGTTCTSLPGGTPTCVAGRCSDLCSAGQTVCGSGVRAGCFDLQTDPLNCGACDNRCPTPRGGRAGCVAGRCTEECDPNFMACGGTCYNTTFTFNHCGRCNNQCTDGPCVDSVCTTTCAAPRQRCGATCADTNNDAANCGACGNTCGAREICRAGACIRGFYRVFVTSTQTAPGALGGVAGADRICQNLADAAGLGGRFMAWVSTRTSSPSTRFITRPTVPYQTLDGTVIASSWDGLRMNGGLLAPIRITERGVPATSPPVTTGGIAPAGMHGAGASVFTNTYQNGISALYYNRTGGFPIGGPDFGGTGCNDLTSTTAGTDSVVYGSYTAGMAPAGWSYASWSYFSTIDYWPAEAHRVHPCATPLSMYCFEQ